MLKSLQLPSNFLATCENRSDFLAHNISRIISAACSWRLELGIDIGAGTGILAKTLAKLLGINFLGLEPRGRIDITSEIDCVRAWPDRAPFNPGSFSVATFVSVFEHVNPHQRKATLKGISDLLQTNGILVAQMPNMNFPIDVHSCLPMEPYLPLEIADSYRKILSPNLGVRNQIHRDWYRVRPGELIRCAKAAGLQLISYERCDYPLEVYPRAAKPIHVLSKVIPMELFMTFKKF